DTCPGGALSLIGNSTNITRGQGAVWQATAPAGLTITGAVVPNMDSSQVNAGPNGAYGGDFYWAGGSSNITLGEYSASLGPLSSSYFGFLLVCGKSSCPGYPQGQIDVKQVTLLVHETSVPTFSAPIGLWQASGWVRGTWPAFAASDSPSGVCSLSVSLNGSQVAQSTATKDPSQWHECAAPWINRPVNTNDYGQGAAPLTLNATDAAGVPAATSKTVSIDNQPPAVSLSGPADAPSTAGPQYVTATATAGPAGIHGIHCSLDGGADQWAPASTARVAVSGVGNHQVSCFSENNALDPSGNRGTSPTESFAVKIGVPTVTGISFSRLVDRLQCRRVRERVTVPSRWVTVRWHHRRIRVRTKPRTKVLRVVKCHARTVQRVRIVVVTVHRHGHLVRVRRRERVRVILLPHTNHRAIRLVAHGRATTVSGWLGTYTGTALGGQTVQVSTAPDDGQERFGAAANVITAADGSWSATLPAGPSRLVQAQYGGNALAEASLSGVAREVVPADVRLLSVTPSRIPWGGTVRLTGRLRGGYLPPGGALVRLRIGLGSSRTTYGVHEHVGGNGRFTTSYTFGAGDPAVRRSFWFQLASLPMGDYPFAPASSGRISVLVGGHPASRRGR
ncbi:MAG: hypothetical protein ACRDNK_24785, partial [Solirubrobacteraceae bacterium]